MTVATIAVVDYNGVADFIRGLVGGTVATRWRSQPRAIVAPSGVDAAGNAIAGAAIPMPSNVGMGQGAKIDLSVVVDSMITTGSEEYGDPDSDGNMPTVTITQYEATWQARIEADMFPSALNIAKKLQKAIWYDSALDDLRALGIVLRTTTNVNCYPFQWGNRVIEYAIFDMLVSYTLTDTPAAENATNYIETMDDPVGAIA